MRKHNSTNFITKDITQLHIEDYRKHNSTNFITKDITQLHMEDYRKHNSTIYNFIYQKHYIRV